VVIFYVFRSSFGVSILLPNSFQRSDSSSRELKEFLPFNLSIDPTLLPSIQHQSSRKQPFRFVNSSQQLDLSSTIEVQDPFQHHDLSSTCLKKLSHPRFLTYPPLPPSILQKPTIKITELFALSQQSKNVDKHRENPINKASKIISTASTEFDALITGIAVFQVANLRARRKDPRPSLVSSRKI